MRAWFLSRSIQSQITTVAIGPVILVTLLVFATQPWPFGDHVSTSYARAIANRIEMVVEQVRVSDSPAQVATILDTVSKTGMRAEVVPLTELQGPSQNTVADRDVRKLIRDILPVSLEPVLRDRTRDGALSDVIVVRADSDTALAFAPEPSGPDALINDEQVDPNEQVDRIPDALVSDEQVDMILMGLLIVLPIMLLAVYASRMITAPLTRFVDTARLLNPDHGPERPFEEGGSLEMVKLASSLNDMRSRIRDMINDRTRMLRAISHDLRTPLTRLRLRAERSTQSDLRATMLKDIEHIAEMIDETLAFLRNDSSAEEPVRADIPSLLQTVCADFADIGFATMYEGPDRFAYVCKPRALTRAISNLVDNGTKFANLVVVRLAVHGTGAVQISVIDDGPGVPEELRQKVLEPFFKASTARTATDHGGFGLGLSIVNDIIRSHGGSVRLLDSNSGGLTVCVNLPAVVRDTSHDGARANPELRTAGRQWLPANNNS
jgi:signal transduction histidine kinase